MIKTAPVSPGKQDVPATRVFGTVAIRKEGPTGPTFIFRRISSAQEAETLQASEEWKTTKLRESYGDFFDAGMDLGNAGNPTAPGSPNNEFVPILGGPFNKQLYLTDYLAMHAKAFEAKNHNPIAKQIVDVITNFTIGKGVTVLFKDETAQAEWNDFVKRNRLPEFLRSDCDSATWAGEFMTQKLLVGGLCVVKHRDPSTCWEVVTDPRDITDVHYYHFQWPTQYQLTYKAGDTASEYVVEDVPADEIIHVRFNVAPGEKRGRSDLYPVLGWLKRFKDYYNAKVVKAQVEESFAIVKTVKGSPEDVAALMADPSITQTPPPGSVIIENEGVTTSFLTPTNSSTSSRDNVGEQIKTIIGTGVGLSPEYLGVSSSGAARATAMQHDKPSSRKFERRQMDMEEYIRQLAEWVVEVGKRTGRIPQTTKRPANMAMLKKAVGSLDLKAVMQAAASLLTGGLVEARLDEGFEVIFPEIETDDRDVKMKQVMNAAVFKAISHERASTMLAKELGVTGYDYTDEQEDIQEEQENKLVQAGMVSGATMGTKTAGAPKPGSAPDDKAFADGQDEGGA